MTESRVPQSRLRTLTAAQLAYVGDAVYSLMSREYIVCTSDYGLNAMHRAGVAVVNCKSQAKAYDSIIGMLDEAEAEIIKRGRNAKTHAPPKNADAGDYTKATALEALIGYLYLAGRDERLSEIMGQILAKDGAKNG